MSENPTSPKSKSAKNQAREITSNEDSVQKGEQTSAQLVNQERYFIAYSPAPSSQLWSLGAAWFGYDAATDEQPKKTFTLGLPPKIHNQAVASARRTGFNAILMAPFTLRSDTNETTLCQGLQTFCKSLAPFRTCMMKIRATNNNNLAIEPLSEDTNTRNLSDDCVHYFNIFREVKNQLPLNNRLKEALSERQIENLVRWGYPYYFDDYKFTIPISGRVPASMASPMAQQLQAIFAPSLGQGMMVDGISLFKQTSIKEPARLIKRTPFRMKSPAIAQPDKTIFDENEDPSVTALNI